MKILKNNLSLVTEIWHDPGDYPSGIASGPLVSTICLEDISGHLIIQIEETDKEYEEWIDWGPELNLHYLMQDVDIEIQGVKITHWQFDPKKHHDINDAAALDLWTVIPYKWDADNFDPCQ